jgi:hypothetical protein
VALLAMRLVLAVEQALLGQMAPQLVALVVLV